MSAGRYMFAFCNIYGTHPPFSRIRLYAPYRRSLKLLNQGRTKSKRTVWFLESLYNVDSEIVLPKSVFDFQFCNTPVIIIRLHTEKGTPKRPLPKFVAAVRYSLRTASAWRFTISQVILSFSKAVLP
jgi:hypothetical protein